MKIYCKGCKYYVCGINEQYCKKADAYEYDSWLEKVKRPIGPWNKNEYNNCREYEVKE